MIWFAWRQFRTPAWIAAATVAVIAVLLAITGHALADQWAASGANTCHGDCGTAVSAFLRDLGSSANWRVYQAITVLMYLLPPVIGIFWGAPLISRELEAGTHRLAWNQSVTRTRWLATKLAVVGTATVATTGLLSWAITSWAHHIDRARFPRISPLIYGARGIVPIGYALFALVLGVTLGMLIRRAVPAMAATLAIYAAAVVSMPLWIRAHLAPVRHALTPLDVDRIQAFYMMQPGGTITVVGNALPSSAWVLGNTTVTPTGQVFTGPADPAYCGADHEPRACLQWVSGLGLRENVTYHPASQFWALQWIETGIFVAVAVLLAGLCFWWIRRRLT